jgi:hypothetical protein
MRKTSDFLARETGLVPAGTYAKNHHHHTGKKRAEASVKHSRPTVSDLKYSSTNRRPQS